MSKQGISELKQAVKALDEEVVRLRQGGRRAVMWNEVEIESLNEKREDVIDAARALVGGA